MNDELLIEKLESITPEYDGSSYFDYGARMVAKFKEQAIAIVRQHQAEQPVVSITDTIECMRKPDLLLTNYGRPRPDIEWIKELRSKTCCTLRDAKHWHDELLRRSELSQNVVESVQQKHGRLLGDIFVEAGAVIHGETEIEKRQVALNFIAAFVGSTIAAMGDSTERLRESVDLLIGYALTSRSHSKECLEGMAERINHTAEQLGDTDRAKAQRDHLRVLRIKNEV